MTPEQKAAYLAGEPDDCSLVMLDMPDGWQSGSADQNDLRMRGMVREAGIRLPYERKIRHALRVLEQAFQKDVNWAVSYSGGRDSSVVSHLIETRLPGVKLPHVMSNTRMEYPETMQTVRRRFEHLRSLGYVCGYAVPEHRPAELWHKIGIPLWSKMIASKYRQYYATGNEAHMRRVPRSLHDAFRRLRSARIQVTDKCCDELKKKPMKKWDKAHGITGKITGTRCSESRARKLMWLQRGTLYNSSRNGTWLCHPLAFWTLQDVLRYINENEVDVTVPKTPSGSSGCVTCLFGCHMSAMEGSENAMQILARQNPRMHQAALGWGYADACQAAGIPDGTGP